MSDKRCQICSQPSTVQTLTGMTFCSECIEQSARCCPQCGADRVHQDRVRAIASYAALRPEYTRRLKAHGKAQA